MTWKWAAGIAMVGIVAATGCSAAPPPGPSSPSTSPAAATTAPDGGVLLRDLGFANAPQGFSVPRESVISDRIDAANNVTAVFTAPEGDGIAAYLREHLGSMGFEITADKNQSLLFRNDAFDGAFTTAGSTAALSLRTDR